MSVTNRDQSSDLCEIHHLHCWPGTEHGLSLRMYADDSLIYDSCPPVTISTMLTDISLAVKDIHVSSWIRPIGAS